ncbi:hypothetical protein AGMMS50229_16360 [Campylobacterota bacterium]|nr:hypothetical protein AGMMS50229_16360 [Campylobacterota bacterium]
MYLSKSRYLKGLQCEKLLWLKTYKKDVFTEPDANTLAQFGTGDRVGEEACRLFGEGKKIEFEGTSFDQKIAMTKEYLANGVRNIFEASFSFNGILVMVDILQLNDDGTLTINEVKSSTEVKDIHLHDCAIQYYVISSLGFTISRVNLLHINNNYVRMGEIERDKLFTIADITEKVIALQSDIPQQLAQFEACLSDSENEPKIDIGSHCSDPYGCDAAEYCWHKQRNIPEYSIFDISRLRGDKKFELYHNGIVRFEDIPDISQFSASQQIQINGELTQKVTVDIAEIRAFLQSLTYPLYHLDFETYQEAVPSFDGVRPYMQIPTQYSLHIEQQNGSLEHIEYLGDGKTDPRYLLAKSLVENIPQERMVIAYNMSFEKSRIKELAEQFPEFHAHLMAICENVVDLMTPFKNKAYYNPTMHGSYSIKAVLPAIDPDMQKAYDNLDGVHNGGDAMEAYANLQYMTAEEAARTRQSLLKYCELDTLAMVKIVQKLKELVR